MTQAVVPATDVAINESQEKEHLFTFQEYLEYKGEPDVLHELVRGQLIPMSAPTIEDTKICEFLVYKLQRYFAAQNISMVAKTTVGVRC
ncbi:MAG: Uma2 family endonuclease [Prochloron sp. SP5CPC1]|nr:Uma2 family endonuclease [Candidatus Paraprochloron terpiosi SP5CPC1]